MIDRKIDLVIFDCDGVLVDSEMISARVFSEILDRVGIPMSTEEVFVTFKGGSMSQSLEHIERILGDKPMPFDIEAAYRKESFEAYQNEMTAVDGVEEILKSLTVPFCVGSNAPQNKIRLNLKLTGLDKYFESSEIFSAYDFQKWKPDPTMFLESAKSFDIAPSKCVVIGDSIADVGAAVAAGMACYAYAPHGDNEGLADAGGTVIKSMIELSNSLNL